MIKLGFNGATTMKASLEEDIRNASTAGFDGLELWGAKLDVYLRSHRPEELARALSSSKLSPLSINSIEDATFSPDRGAVLARCREWSMLSEKLKNPVIVVVPGVAPQGCSPREIVDRSARELRELCDIAAPRGVRLAFEMIGGQGRSVSELGRAREVVMAAERKNLGLVVDTFHAFVGGTRAADLKGLERSLLDIVHLNDAEEKPIGELRDSHRLFPGDGALPLGELLGALSDYSGVVSVEIFRPEYWERDPSAVARTAIEKARAVLREAGLA
ncbi:MAG: sugar phosphate isomerase/epimerase [Myxococcales bacterium]|nr:sugar phosphate isomerase/epimerase [Myxococcales bacterium]